MLKHIEVPAMTYTHRFTSNELLSGTLGISKTYNFAWGPVKVKIINVRPNMEISVLYLADFMKLAGGVDFHYVTSAHTQFVH